ncbi:MAG: hypothetical protein WC829_10705 [Hyphomicrobium sp.]|jgi:putative chitinase
MAVDKQHFFDAVRTSLFGGTLTPTQVAVMDGIINSFSGPHDELAYVLSTPYHEVGRRLEPATENLNYSAKRMTEVWPSRFKTLAAAKPYANNPEALGNKVYGGRLGNDQPGDGYKYRGRGLSQITGKGMYAKFARLLNIDLVGNPDLALRPDIAARILVVGMRDGLFTGKKLRDYIGNGKLDYKGARAIINDDVAKNGAKIAGYANKFRAALRDQPAVLAPEEVAAGHTEPPAPVPPVPPVSKAPNRNGVAALLAMLGGLVVAILKAMGWIG